MNNKLKIYNEVVKTLMDNDHNATWDETIEDADNNLEYAIYLVKIALERIVNEEDLEDKELKFYKIQLEKISTINTMK